MLLLHLCSTHATSPPFTCTFTYGALTHTPSQHLCRSTRVMRVPHHHHLCATLLPTIPCSHTLTLISTFATFTHLCSPTHPDLSCFSYIQSRVRMLVHAHQFAHIGYGLTFNLKCHTSTLPRIFLPCFVVLFSVYDRHHCSC